MRKIQLLFLLAVAPAVWGGEISSPAAAPAETSVASSTGTLSPVSTGIPAATPVETPAALRARAKALWSQRKTSAEPWLLLGKAYEAEGKNRKALKTFQKAINVDPLCAEAYFRRGRLFEQKGKLDEAGNEYQAALKADRHHIGAAAAWKALSERLDAKSGK